MPSLSPRLTFLKGFLLEGGDVWDLCCDHGYLGEAALRAGVFRHVHFVDRVPEIIARLRERLGDAEGASFHAIDAGQLTGPLEGTVVIAGVGADSARKILNDLESREALKADRVIVCPQTEEHLMEADLKSRRGTLERFEIKEGPRTRIVFVWDRLL